MKMDNVIYENQIIKLTGYFSLEWLEDFPI